MSELPLKVVTEFLEFGEKFATQTEDEGLAMVLKTAGSTVTGFETFAGENPLQAAAVLLATTAVAAALAPEIAAGAGVLAESGAMGAIGDCLAEILETQGWTDAAAEAFGKSAITAVSEFVSSYVVKKGAEALFTLAQQVLAQVKGTQTQVFKLSTSVTVLTPSSLPEGNNFLLLQPSTGGQEQETSWNFPNTTVSPSTIGINYNGTDMTLPANGWSSITLKGTVTQVAYTDGTSAMTTVNLNGSTTTQTFSGPNDTGPLIGEDTEDPDGTSLVVTGKILPTGSTTIGIELPGGGTVTNSTDIDASEYGVWMPDGPGTVTNDGTIIGTEDDGIEIGGSATVTNNLLIKGANGVSAGGAGKLINAGTIDATGGSGVSFGHGGSVTNTAGKLIEGTSGGVVITSVTGTIINSGTILASSGEAVESDSGGSVSNSTAATLIDGNDYGVWMPDGSGTVTNVGTIIGTNDDAIEIGGSATVTNYLRIQGANGIFAGGAGTLINAGTIDATGGSGVSFGDGGSVSNGAGKLIEGTSGGVVITDVTGQVVSTGTILASSGEAVELDSGGVVDNLAMTALIDGGDYGVWMPDGPGNVTNDGTIIGTDDDAIGIGDNASVVNNLLIRGANGVSAGGAGTLLNAGTIDATGGSGISFGHGGNVTNNAGKLIEGTSGGIVITTATGKIINSGTILSSTGEAVELASGGSVSNATAAALIDGGDYGVWMPGGPGTVTNSGTIIGTEDDGIDIGGNGAHVTNTGTISGSTGVDFTGTGGTLVTSGKIIGTGGVAVNLGTDNTLIEEAGATFVGKVLDPGFSDTLELSDGSPGTLAGLGTSIVGFGTVVVDTGASWTLPGSSSADVLHLSGTATVAAGGQLDVATIDPASIGVFDLAAHASLDIGKVLGGQAKIAFVGAATLVVGNASTFGIGVGSTAYAGPLLEHFAAGATIDVADVTASGLHLQYAASTGLLALAGSSGQIEASMRFQTSSLGSGTFHLGTDGHGGTLLTLV
jgi:hypothetical protein